MKVSFPNKRFLCAAAFAVGILGHTKVHAQAAVEAWVQRYNGPTGGSDGAGKIVVDSSDNVIVAGVSTMGWLIVKYSSAGVSLWTAGPAKYGDGASDMAVDGSGNIIVTGSSASYYENATIKYSSAGVPLWTNRWPTTYYNTPYAMAVDGSGNVFVTGFATIKYSSAGVPLWTNRFSGGGKALAVDSNGDVVVTGTIYVGDPTYPYNYDYTTIKYSNAGVPLWTNRYDSGVGTSDDRVSAVAVDSSGNVFVTGESYTRHAYPFTADYATVAYSSAGVPLWTNRYGGPGNSLNSPVALAVDGSGNVFITGTSATNLAIYNYDYDYATIAYSGAGVPLWTNRYRSAQASTVAVDSSGNVAVTGYSYGSGIPYDYITIKYSGAGVPLWTNRYNGPANGYDAAYAVTVDGSDNVLVTGSSEGIGTYSDFATIKYSSAGVPLWTNRYNGPGSGDDQANAIAVDGDGGVVVTGTSLGTNRYSDYATIKYSNAGLPLWTNRYNGGYGPTNVYMGGNGVDLARAVAVDGSGNVFVTGASCNANGLNPYTDYATVAYSSAGLPLWTNRYNEADNHYASASAVAVDGSGNVFVTGIPATIKYSGTGVPLWTNLSSWPWPAYGFAPAVAVDGSGDVVVTGTSYVNFSSYDYATIKYSSAGVPLWTNRYNATWDSFGFPSALTVDSNGNVLVTGRLMTGGSYDYATIKYSNTGVPLWTNRYNGPGNSDDAASSLALDGSGNVFVTGGSGRITNHTYFINYATVAYSSAGVPLWTNLLPRTGFGDAYATSVAVDITGKVFVTGICDSDYATVKYSNAGVPLWTNRYNGPGNDFDFASTVAADRSGNVFVTGYSATTGGYNKNYDYVTIKYSSAGPLLSIVRTMTNTLAVSWPLPAAGFTLQQNINVVSTNWVPVGITPTDDGTNKTVVVDPPEGNRFYRLFRP